MQLLYPRKLSRPKYHEFNLKVLIFSMLQYWDIDCKTVTILFYLLIIQLTVYNRTITRFIADDKVVYQRVRREMRLASDNSRVWRRLKHLSWRSRWIIMCTLERRMAVSCEISRADRCLFGLSTWLRTRSSTAMRRSRSVAAWLPDNCTRLVASLQQTVDASNFPTIVRKFTQRPLCTISFWQIEILNQNLTFLWSFHDFV